MFKRFAVLLNEYLNVVKIVTIDESKNEIVTQDYKELGIFLLPINATRIKFNNKMSVMNLIHFYNENVSNSTKINVSAINFEPSDSLEIDENLESEENNSNISNLNDLSEEYNNYNNETPEKNEKDESILPKTDL